MVRKLLPVWGWVVALFVAGTTIGEEPTPKSTPPAEDAGTAQAPPTVLPPVDDADFADVAAPKAESLVQPPAPSSESTDVQKPAGKSDPAKPLDRPLDSKPTDAVPSESVDPDFLYRMDPPLGFTGRSSVVPTVDPSADFVPIEDRWRIGFPAWDRYDRGHFITDDYPNELGHWWDPFQQNVLKGDYPIAGQHTFLIITAQSNMILDGRQTPIPTGIFESTARPLSEEFFGSPNQLGTIHYLKFAVDVNHGDAAFKPTDWRVKLTPIFNYNQLNVDEIGAAAPDVRKGTQRQRSFLALEEYFVEYKIADLSPDYDFVSSRVGSQFFSSDFKGFLFNDTNRAVRIFGTLNANREQFNLVYFRQAEKDTNSALNTMDDRRQNIVIANFYRQDFIWPGLTATASIHYNNDGPSRRFETNSFRARPDNAGVFQPHNIDVGYIGFGLDGHIERYNITSQLYYAFGRDSMNPIGNRGQDISAGMAAVELSYDRDWARFRTSFFWSSGDHNPNNTHATGFDTILDNPNFAGGEFSYWQRQGIGLFGVLLTSRESLIPNLRGGKIQSQSNFVNPGLLLMNFGMDADVTPRLKLISNVNFLWFQDTAVLETFLFDGNIGNRIGTDVSVGFEYRPLFSNNIQFIFGVSTLIPGAGFKALYNEKASSVDPLVGTFFQSILQF